MVSLEHGDQWIHVVKDSVHGGIISFMVGRRDGAMAKALVADARRRIVTAPSFRLNVSTDGYKPYSSAVRDSFKGCPIDYGQVVKTYRKGKIDDWDEKPILGDPDIVTSHVERANLTARMNVSFLARFSLRQAKTLESLKAAVAVHYTFQNFCTVHSPNKAARKRGLTLPKGRSPAQGLGVTDHVWSNEEFLLAVLDEAKRGIPAPHEPLSKRGSIIVAKVGDRPTAGLTARELKVLRDAHRRFVPIEVDTYTAPNKSDWSYVDARGIPGAKQAFEGLNEKGLAVVRHYGVDGKPVRVPVYKGISRIEPTDLGTKLLIEDQLWEAEQAKSSEAAQKSVAVRATKKSISN